MKPQLHPMIDHSFRRSQLQSHHCIINTQQYFVLDQSRFLTLLYYDIISVASPHRFDGDTSTCLTRPGTAHRPLSTAADLSRVSVAKWQSQNVRAKLSPSHMTTFVTNNPFAIERYFIDVRISFVDLQAFCIVSN